MMQASSQPVPSVLMLAAGCSGCLLLLAVWRGAPQAQQAAWEAHSASARACSRRGICKAVGCQHCDVPHLIANFMHICLGPAD